jgi:hypothetical protein
LIGASGWPVIRVYSLHPPNRQIKKNPTVLGALSSALNGRLDFFLKTVMWRMARIKLI